MKSKINVPALFLASVVFIATTGVSAFEHICTSSNTRNFSLFTNVSCKMEKPLAPCCAKLAKKKNCCEHKQFFSKLSVEGFIAKPLTAKIFHNNMAVVGAPLFESWNRFSLENHFSGLPPPDNLWLIKSLLQPSPTELQVFRC